MDALTRNSGTTGKQQKKASSAFEKLFFHPPRGICGRSWHDRPATICAAKRMMGSGRQARYKIKTKNLFSFYIISGQAGLVKASDQKIR
jgi:hypothetical protein